MDGPDRFWELVIVFAVLSIAWVGLVFALSVVLMSCGESDPLSKPMILDASPIIDGGHMCRAIVEPGWSVRCCRVPERPDIDLVCWQPPDAGD